MANHLLIIAFFVLFLGAFAGSMMLNLTYSDNYSKMDRQLRILAWIFPLSYNVLAVSVLYVASLYDKREGPPPSQRNGLWTINKTRSFYRLMVVIYFMFNISIEYMNDPTMKRPLLVAWAFASGIFIAFANVVVAHIFLRTELYGQNREMPPCILLLEAFQFLITIFSIVIIAGEPSRNVRKEMEPILLILRWFLVWLKPVFYCAIQYGIFRKPAEEVLHQIVIQVPPPVAIQAEGQQQLREFPVNFYDRLVELARQPPADDSSAVPV